MCGHLSFTGVPSRQYALRVAVDGSGPSQQIAKRAAETITVIVSEFLACRLSLTSAIDECDSCRGILAARRRYEFCYPPTLSTYGCLLAMDRPRCGEESGEAKVHLAALQYHLSGTVESTLGWERRVATRHIAMCLAALSRLHEGADNLPRALDYSREARATAHGASDAEMERLALHLQAKILQRMGQSFVAAAMRRAADQLVLRKAPSTIFLEFALWGLSGRDHHVEEKAA
jgi:hypothetical protein